MSCQEILNDEWFLLQEHFYAKIFFNMVQIKFELNFLLNLAELKIFCFTREKRIQIIFFIKISV